MSFVFLNVLLEQLGLPIPALPAFVVAGALATQGVIPWAPLLVAIFVATLAADSLWYALGRRHGSLVLRLVCKVSLSPDTCVRQTENLFERWGLRALLLAKFIPGFSMVASPLAGSLRLSFPRFLLFDFGGTALWAGSGLLLGVIFRDTVESALANLEALGNRALLLLGAALVVFVFVKWFQRRRFYRFLRMSRIEPLELRGLMEGGTPPLVFDVRGKQSRELDPRTIPGAFVLELPEIDAQVTGLPRDGFIVLYCT